MSLLRIMKLGSQVAGKRGTLDVPRLLPPDMLSMGQKAFAARTAKLKGKGTQIETVGSLDEKKLQVFADFVKNL